MIRPCYRTFERCSRSKNALANNSCQKFDKKFAYFISGWMKDVLNGISIRVPLWEQTIISVDASMLAFRYWCFAYIWDFAGSRCDVEWKVFWNISVLRGRPMYLFVALQEHTFKIRVVLELRRYKNDRITWRNLIVLKLARFFTRLYSSEKAHQFQNK